MARQDSRQISPEKGRDAECIYYSETGTVKMDRACYQDTWGTLSKENPLWWTRNGQTLPWWSEKTHSKPPSRATTYQQCRGNKLHMTEQSGAASSEEVLGKMRQKRISEAEQKRWQRKARAKASPTELTCSDLRCFICKRQFRARIGLISNLRAHRQ